MIESLKFVSDLGYEVDFVNDENVHMSGVTGLDGQSVAQNTTQGYKQNGTTCHNIYLEEREVEVSFWIETKTHQEYEILRGDIYKKLPALKEGWLYYKDEIHDVMLRCHVSILPNLYLDDVCVAGEGTVTFLANDPVLYDRVETAVEIAEWDNGWKHKWSGRFHLKQKGSKTKTILNDGQVAVPVKLTYQGEAQNPAIHNSTTGKWFAIKEGLAINEIMEVETRYKGKTVKIRDTITGDLTNAEHRITNMSEFWWLDVGENVIRYAQDTDVNNSVYLIYRRGYMSV